MLAEQNAEYEASLAVDRERGQRREAEQREREAREREEAERIERERWVGGGKGRRGEGGRLEGLGVAAGAWEWELLRFNLQG